MREQGTWHIFASDKSDGNDEGMTGRRNGEVGNAWDRDLKLGKLLRGETRRVVR